MKITQKLFYITVIIMFVTVSALAVFSYPATTQASQTVAWEVINDDYEPVLSTDRLITKRDQMI